MLITLFALLLLVLLLMLLYLRTKLHGRFHKRVFYGLVIYMAGILFFVLKAARYASLLPTMFFYIVPQIFFLNAFYLDFKSAPALDKRGARLSIAAAFILSLGYYILIREHLGILKLPVMICLFTTSFMFMMACFRNQRVNKASFRLVLAAVLCIAVAEAISAYSHLVNTITYIDFIYTAISLIGLSLLVMGTISRKLQHQEN